MTKADGTHVTVKFDKNFRVTAVQAGMGAGGPGGRAGGPAWADRVNLPKEPPRPRAELASDRSPAEPGA
jgi:hypothetical protein